MGSYTTRDVHVDAALSTLSIAYRQENPAYSDLIFPRVPVAKQSDKFYVWSKADAWRRNVAKRAPGTRAARASIGNSTSTYFSEQYALEHFIEDEKRRNADPAINPEETGTRFLTDQHALEKDYQWTAAYMSASAGWGSGSLGSGGKWNTSTGAPVTDVQNWTRTIKRALGASRQHKFVGVCGTIVEAALIGNTQIRNSSIYVQQGTVTAVRASLAAVLGIDELVVIDREYNTAAEGKAASYSPLADDDFLVVAVPRAPGLDVPSAGYTFEWDDGQGTMYVEMYRDEPNKSDVLRAIQYFDMKQTGTDLGVFAADVTD